MSSKGRIASGGGVLAVGKAVRPGGLDHRRDAIEPLRFDSTCQPFPGQCSASRLVVLAAAVIDGVVERDGGFQGGKVGDCGAVAFRQRKQGLDMRKAVIVAPGSRIERRETGAHRSVDEQGAVLMPA